MNDVADAPAEVERQVMELAAALIAQAEKVSELARLLVSQIERRLREEGEDC